MTNQRLTIALILMMVITPIASAYNHCAGIDMHRSMSVGQQMADTVPAKSSSDKTIVTGQKQADMQCHSCHNCAFHVCASFGISASTTGFIAIASSYSFLHSQHSPLYNTALATEIKPPIRIL